MLAATALALGSAMLHATWNLLLKRSPRAERDLTSWGLFCFGAVLVLPALVVLGGPGRAALGWLALSMAIHVAYIVALVSAYRHGDFSLAYPLARGGGALVAAVGGAALLGDSLPIGGWIAISLAAGGLVSLIGRPVSTSAVRDALVTAVAIGSYTIVDAKGARAATDALAYGLATTVASALGITVWFVAKGRTAALLSSFGSNWRTWALGGACSAGAYAMVVVALRTAPVGYVAMLRESSVVLGAAIGWLVLREPLGGRRLVSASVILAGLVGLVATTI